MVDYLPEWYPNHELVDMVQFMGVQRPRYKAVRKRRNEKTKVPSPNGNTSR